MLRIGEGFDIHRLTENRRLVVGGVDIPFEKGLLGHSDADVLLHAVTDALLGACALGDIGTHFPDTDPMYKDADSLVLLKNAALLAAKRGFHTVNIDATVILQQPKLAPYLTKMRENIASALAVDITAVSVKAKTNEGLGEIGRGEAAQAHCVLLVSD